MPLPCTGGHEVAGEIAALGPGVNTKLWAKGQRVAVRLLYNCGECYYCRTGRTNMCERAQKKPVREGLLPGPGGLCDYIIVDAASLFKIPDTLSYEEACLTEPLACCVHSVSRANIQLGEDVVIIGGGIMGQYHVMLAKRRGARVILSEVDPARRALAENLGADITLNPMEQDPVEFVKGITDGRGADVVFNTTAIPSVVPQAIAMVGKGGPFYFRRFQMEKQEQGKLGLGACIAILTGGCIGSAIFSISGMTMYYAGPASVLSWILGAIILACMAFR